LNIDLELVEKASQNELDIPMWIKLTQMKEKLDSFATDPPTTLLDSVKEYSQRSVDRFLNNIKSHPTLFLPTKNRSIRQLESFDFRALSMARIQRCRGVCDSSVLTLRLQMKHLMDGRSKRQLTDWWLGKIEDAVHAWLRERGYDFDAIPEHYTHQPPRDHQAVHNNLKLVQEVLDRKLDMHNVQAFLENLKNEIYPKIDQFVDYARISIFAQLNLKDKDFEPTEVLELLAQATDDTLEPTIRAWISDMLKDILYLEEMREMEKVSEPGKLQLSNVVPIGGLILSCFFRIENELKTIEDLWPDPKILASKKKPPGLTSQPPSGAGVSLSALPAPSSPASSSSPDLNEPGSQDRLHQLKSLGDSKLLRTMSNGGGPSRPSRPSSVFPSVPPPGLPDPVLRPGIQPSPRVGSPSSRPPPKPAKPSRAAEPNPEASSSADNSVDLDPSGFSSDTTPLSSYTEDSTLSGSLDSEHVGYAYDASCYYPSGEGENGASDRGLPDADTWNAEATTWEAGDTGFEPRGMYQSASSSNLTLLSDTASPLTLVPSLSADESNQSGSADPVLSVDPALSSDPAPSAEATQVITKVYPNGDKYIGQYLQGKRDGKGLYIYSNGDIYDGFYRNGQFEGPGIFHFANGDVYEGDFASGMFHGQGSLKTGAFHYTGAFEEDCFHGFGILRFNQGDTYEGEFVNDLRHGPGIYTYADGGRFEGLYFEGKTSLSTGKFFGCDGLPPNALETKIRMQIE
ncbi:MAG: hypothetical protein Q8P67_10445, partial [archaeon]|nr:hypothetical protein [archaeon]